MKNIKSKNDFPLVPVAAVIVVLALGIITVNPFGFHPEKLSSFQTQSVANPSATPSTLNTPSQATGALISCPTGVATLRVDTASRNVVNGSADFTGDTVVITDASGKNIVSGTTTNTAGTTLAYATTTISCTPQIYTNGIHVVSLGDTGSGAYTSYVSPILNFVSKDATGNTVAGTGVQYTGSLARGTALGLQLLDSAGTQINAIETGSGASGSFSTTDLTENQTATAIGQNTNRVFRLAVRANTGGQAWGSVDGGMLIGVDTNDTASWASSDVSITAYSGDANWKAGFKEIACSKYANTAIYQTLKRCWIAPQLTSKMGSQVLEISETASLGNPGTTGSPIIKFVNIVYGRDLDGSIILEGYNSAGTALGQTRQRVSQNLT